MSAAADILELQAHPERQRRAFLAALFPDAKGVLDVRLIEPDGVTKREPCNGFDAAEVVIRRGVENHTGVYVGVATRRTDSRAEGSGNKENLAEVQALWADLDFEEEGDAEAFEVALEGFTHPPSMRVSSGGGLHVYWLLKEPYEFTTPEALERFEDTLKGIADFLHADFRATDATRILRVPGTVNHPNAKKRSKGRTSTDCTLLELHEEHRYMLDDFEPFAVRGAAIRREKREPALYERAPWDGELPPAVKRALEKSSEARKRWDGDDSGLKDCSDSGIDLALANQLSRELRKTLDHHETGQAVEAALRARREKCGAKAKHSKYYTDTVGRALQWTEKRKREEPPQAKESPQPGNEEPPPLHAATVEEILSDRLPDTRCERLVWEGNTTLFVGLSKQGKSYAAVQLALCIASGIPFLGLEVKRSRVLYVSWELSLAALLSRMRNIARDCDLPDPEPLLREGWIKFYAHRRDATAPRLDLQREQDWPRLRQLLEDEGTEVLFIDTLRKSLPGIELKDDIGWSLALGRFNRLARETGLGQVLIDHGHRGRTGESAAVFAMGSQVKGSELPCLVKLERTRKEGDPDRWSIEVDSWFDDSGEPIWYERPEDSDAMRGCGCVLCDAPPAPTLKRDTALEMEKWLRNRLEGGVSVGSTAIYEEAAGIWPNLEIETLKRKLRRAHEAIGGVTEDVKGAKVRQTLWRLG